MVISLECSIAKGAIQLPTCIYNASGPRSGTSTALSKVYHCSSTGAVLSKSATLLKQDGNPLPRTWHSCSDPKATADDNPSFNSEGLPNNGIDYYISKETIQEIVSDDDNNNSKKKKPYMISISGKTIADNLEMIQRIYASVYESQNTEIQGIEFNLACPNVIGKPIIGYDFEQMKDIFQQVSQCIEKDLPKKYKNFVPLPLGIKLPPYFDFIHYDQVASIINSYSNILSYIVTTNTIGNTLPIDSISEIPCILSNNGYAGLSGSKSIKYIALANVRKFRSLLHKDIDIIGVGGITTGQDVFEFILCGASAVQIGTCHWKEGTDPCFHRIHDELLTIMKEKNYTCLDDFKGKLKPYTKELANQSRLIRKEKEKEKQQPSPKNQSNPSSSSTTMLYSQYLNIVFIIIIAILLKDKFS